MCFTSFDNGITHFDLANNYGPAYGSAERNFGKLFREELHPYRDEMFISTKAGFDMWEGPYGNWGSRKYLLQAWTRVLSDLDLIMSISSIITEWILRHHLRRLWVHLKCPFVINQNRYSIFDRTIENNGLKDTAYELGKGIIAFSPLAQELLTKRYLMVSLLIAELPLTDDSLMRLHLHQKSFPRFRHLTKLLWKEDRRLPRWLLAGF